MQKENGRSKEPLHPSEHRNRVSGERGMVLLIVVICSLLLIVLGLSLTYSTMSEFSMSMNAEARERARMVADSGFNLFKDTFRGTSLEELITESTTVPKYLDYTIPVDEEELHFFNRNPLALLEAINLNFANPVPPPPIPGSDQTITGLLPPPAGTPAVNYGPWRLGRVGDGWFMARVTDNRDEAALIPPQADDPLVDQDGRVYLRVMGITRGAAGQVSAYGSSANAVSIVEATLKQDKTMDFSAPFTAYGQDSFHMTGGNQFPGNMHIDGYDHPGMTLQNLQDIGNAASRVINHDPFHDPNSDTVAIQAVFDDPGGNDAAKSKATIYDYIVNKNPDQTSDIIGPNTDIPGPPPVPSLSDGTDSIRNDPDPDAQQLFDPNYVMNFVNRAAAMADYTFDDGDNINQDLGTDADPKITYCKGKCQTQGNHSGSGLWIVKGELEIRGNYDYHGLIVVVGADGAGYPGSSGAGHFRTEGTMRVLGGIFASRLLWNGTDYEYPYDPSGNIGGDQVRWTVTGSSEFYFQGSGLALGYSMLGMKMESWREIPRELEPY